MSASLVGSEMCIRDSSRSVPSPRSRKPRTVATTGPPPPQVPAGSASVSYTHLTLPTICSV
eukprot:6893910-Alexandrium_andersonii.AAC.1